MDEGKLFSAQGSDGSDAGASGSAYEPPSSEILSLSCEISAYAPDGDDSPLF